MINKGMMSSATCEWATPQKLFDDLNEEFHFTLDACANAENHKCERYYTKEQDALKQSWKGETVFCNPPYGKELQKFVKKAAEEVMNQGTTVVLLIPARTDTSYFHDYILGKHEIRFIRGRIKFGGSVHNAPFPSMVVVMRNNNNFNF